MLASGYGDDIYDGDGNGKAENCGLAVLTKMSGALTKNPIANASS